MDVNSNYDAFKSPEAVAAGNFQIAKNIEIYAFKLSKQISIHSERQYLENLLEKNGADFNDQKYGGQTALIWAAINGNF